MITNGNIPLRRREPFVHVSAVLFLCAVQAATADTIHVPADQPTIQAGLDAAVNGDEVVVAPGTYALGQFEFISISSKTITLRSSDGAAVTTIQGGGGLPVLLLGSNDSTVEGFTIIGGRQNGIEFVWGGGISINGGSPTIADCTFIDNIASDSETGGAIGGAPSGTSGTVTGCTFEGNESLNGGAIRLRSATISNCAFESNTALLGDGGAVHVALDSVIEDCTFLSNSATSEGGAVYSVSTTSITGCTFTANTAGVGGGVWAAEATIGGSVFEGNSAGTGGGVWVDGGSVTGCDFVDNAATNGAGLAMIGGDVTGCAFDMNTATGAGGGLHLTGTSPLVTLCTFRGNGAGAGGGLYVGGGVTATLTDSTFCQNTPDDIDSDGVVMTSGVVIAIDGADCDEAVTSFGACCLPSGECVLTSEANCNAAGGAYQGDGTTCSDVTCPPDPCPADTNGDGLIDVVDLLNVLGAWGSCF